MWRRGGRRKGPGPRTPADGSGWDRPLRSHEDRGPPGWREAGDDRGGEATIRVSPIAPSGGSRITRFGKPKRGAKETTAWATIIPNAAPRTAPAREIRTACAS